MKATISKILPIFVFFLLLLFQSAGKADLIIVDPNGTQDYTTIQDAIDNADNGDVIEVQPATYYERINFYGKAITVTGTDPNNINVVYATVIDGGLSGNVVTFDSGEDNSSVLKGMTVQNCDKGIYCYYSDPLILKCVIRYANSIGISGSSASPLILDTIVRENNTGISSCGGEITDCEIIENTGIGINYCNGPITDCQIVGNSSTGLNYCDGSIKTCVISGNNKGLYDCDGQVTNCVVSSNRSHGLESCGQIINCTIAGNKGSGLVSCGTAVHNNIIVQNWYYGISSGTSNLKYNNVWGNLSGNYGGVAPGPTDTHENPRFAVDGYWDGDDNWVEGDYHIKSVAGRWTETGWVNDDVTSPCIDAGDPTGGYFYEPAPNGGRINQGAYGGTIYASKSPYGPEPYCGQYIPGDANLDCKIDFLDFAIMTLYWLECNLEPPEACWE